MIDATGAPAQSDTAFIVQDGRFSWIGPPAVLDPALPVTDLSGKYVIPGLLDANCHLVSGTDPEYLLRYEPGEYDELTGSRIFYGGNILGMGGPVDRRLLLEGRHRRQRGSGGRRQREVGTGRRAGPAATPRRRPRADRARLPRRRWGRFHQVLLQLARHATADRHQRRRRPDPARRHHRPVPDAGIDAGAARPQRGGVHGVPGDQGPLRFAADRGAGRQLPHAHHHEGKERPEPGHVRRETAPRARHGRLPAELTGGAADVDHPGPAREAGYLALALAAGGAGVRHDPNGRAPGPTRNIAETYGKLDEIGTIEPGKRTDFLVLNEDPLADPVNYRAIASVVKDGVAVDRDRLPENPVYTRKS